MKLENFNIEYIIIFIILILPGFLMMKIIKLKVPSKNFLLKDMLFEALSYSLLNLSLIAWLPYLALKNEWHYSIIIISFIIAVVLIPILLAFAYIKIISSKYFRENFDILIPTAWNWYFSQRPHCMLLISLKNGSEVIGYFGNKSYATSYPSEESIYLETVYKYDDKNELTMVPNSDGMVIAKNEFSTIQFYKIGENDE